MNNKLYELCNWAEIEEVVYSEHDNPHNILGAHKTEHGILVNAFIPRAVSVTVKLTKTGKEYPMELVDENGTYDNFFSCLLPGKKILPYTYIIKYDNDTEQETSDPYSFGPIIDATDRKKFAAGIHYEIYDKLGAHPMVIDGIAGVLFAVWAPNAIRVSVVGDFNIWDGRRHQMRRLEDSGIFELFIPDIKEDDIYKYEIKVRSDLITLKADPYGNFSELRPDTASIVKDINHYSWNDKQWLDKRKKTDYDKEAMVIYEVHLGSWRKPEEDDRDFYNYRELAPMLADYVTDMGYTHIELMPIMEHPFDASWGYQVTGYYAPTSRYGTPEDFMYFMDYMHQKNIGVILDWVPAHFPRDAFGLANFDGTCLYEHFDPRQGSHPHWGTLIYNYGRPQVANFLIANALFWVEKYHADGIRMDAVASMLYLDYGKNHGEWVANMYGGNENLEAIELFKNLNKVFKMRKDGSVIIAEESTAWPKITGSIEDSGLGFDYKWNMGWMNDFTNYMKCDPLFRKGHHGELTFSMVYAYSEKFILVLSHDEVVHGKGSMINKMPGEYEEKFANLRAAYGFMMAHPGKKLLFMGQEFAQFTEWSEERSLDWGLMEYDTHRQMKEYVKALNRLYQDYPAFYSMDFSSDGFEWINDMDSDRSVVSFLRKTKHEEETLLIVCNFTPVVYKDYKVGVPFKGKYKETFNSDKGIFGGGDNVNPRLKQSKEEEMDERDHSISITVPPLGITVFTCTPVIEKKTVKKTTTRTAAKTVEDKTVKSKKETATKSVTVKNEAKTEETGTAKPASKKTKKADSIVKESVNKVKSAVKSAIGDVAEVKKEVDVTVVEPSAPVETKKKTTSRKKAVVADPIVEKEDAKASSNIDETVAETVGKEAVGDVTIEASKSELKSELKSETKTETAEITKAEPKTVTKTEDKTDTKTESKPKKTTKAKAVTKTEAKPKVEAEPKAKSKAKTKLEESKEIIEQKEEVVNPEVKVEIPEAEKTPAKDIKQEEKQDDTTAETKVVETETAAAKGTKGKGKRRGKKK